MVILVYVACHNAIIFMDADIIVVVFDLALFDEKFPSNMHLHS